MKSNISFGGIANLGTILGVWAHPDDETFTCGGLLAAAVQDGQRVVCITATKGEAGVQDEARWPASQLGEIRAQELKAALDILGIKEHHWLGYYDGKVDSVPMAEGVEKVLEIAKAVQPDTIVTFGPDGMTGHTDHITVSKWVSEVAKRLPKTPRVLQVCNLKQSYDDYFKEADEKFNIYFNLDKPKLVLQDECTLCIKLSSEFVRKKYQALKAMPSQTEAMLSAFSEEWALGAFGTETFIEEIPS